LRHLVKANEILGHVLLSTHNVHFLLALVRRLRAAIVQGDLLTVARAALERDAPESSPIPQTGAS
jgi:queuine tRNA-ribosyltransferase